MSKVIVVGGGPAGIMAALEASKYNEVLLIERNHELGKKLRLTGGGRCNITNNRYIEEFFDKVVTNNKFLYSAFYTFTNEDLLKYFSNKGLKYKVEYDEKVYTMSDKADEVIEILKKDLEKNKVKVMYGTSNGLLGTLASTCIGLGALAMDGQATAMTQTTVAADFAQPHIGRAHV